MTPVPSDAELARSLDGDFESWHAEVNGVDLHYVIGGETDPLVLLGGWPQTWWAFRKIMPPLARQFQVIAVRFTRYGSIEQPGVGR